MKLYVIGDIEGMSNIYQSTIQCLQRKKDKRSNSFLFLGDIYTPNNVNESIAHIENITKTFFDIHSYLNEESEPIDLIRILRDIWKNKGLKSYNLRHIQYWKSMPKQDLSQTNKYFKYKFLFGNKEIKFIHDILNSKNIQKETIDNSSHLIIPVIYEDKNTNTTVENTITFSYHQLNVMINYLYHCYNYCIMNDILFTHCYFNYAKLMEGMNVKTVVCGHSRGYGVFKDSRFPEIDIYMIDFTGLKDGTRIECTNFDNNIKNYFTINNLNTQGEVTIKVEPSRIRPLSLSSLSIKVIPRNEQSKLFRLTNIREDRKRQNFYKSNTNIPSTWNDVTKELLNISANSNNNEAVNNKNAYYVPPCLRNKRTPVFELGTAYNSIDDKF